MTSSGNLNARWSIEVAAFFCTNVYTNVYANVCTNVYAKRMGTGQEVLCSFTSQIISLNWDTNLGLGIQ